MTRSPADKLPSNKGCMELNSRVDLFLFIYLFLISAWPAKKRY